MKKTNVILKLMGLATMICGGSLSYASATSPLEQSQFAWIFTVVGAILAVVGFLIVVVRIKE